MTRHQKIFLKIEIEIHTRRLLKEEDDTLVGDVDVRIIFPYNNSLINKPQLRLSDSPEY